MAAMSSWGDESAVGIGREILPAPHEEGPDEQASAAGERAAACVEVSGGAGGRDTERVVADSDAEGSVEEGLWVS
jgi:hypothetical protein